MDERERERKDREMDFHDLDQHRHAMAKPDVRKRDTQRAGTIITCLQQKDQEPKTLADAERERERE